MVRKISVFVRRKFRRIFKNAINKKDIELLKDKDFVIIANNCWGGEVYNWFNRSYNSPFVGLFIYGPCYLKLLSSFKEYMNQELKFKTTSKYDTGELNYPVGILKDVEIHFLHYKTKEDALTKWNRRTKRMLEVKNLDNYFFKNCDMYETTENLLQHFHQLPFKNKVSFSYSNFKSLKKTKHIQIQESNKTKIHVPNGVKLFKLTFLYFNLPVWLSN
jgi:uncharacterized protein (DUF1919 family)